MSTETSARGIAGSLRLAGVTAAVAVGLVGLGAAPASAATAAGGDIPDHACVNMERAGVPMDVYLKHGCIVIPAAGEITGGSIFG